MPGPYLSSTSGSNFRVDSQRLFLSNCTLTFEVTIFESFEIAYILGPLMSCIPTDEADHRIALDDARGWGFRASPSSSADAPSRKDRILRDSTIAPDCVSLSAPWSLGVPWPQTSPDQAHEHRGAGGPHPESKPLNR